MSTYDEITLFIKHDPVAQNVVCEDNISKEYGVGDTVQEAIADWISELDSFERCFSTRTDQLGESLREELRAVQAFLYPPDRV